MHMQIKKETKKQNGPPPIRKNHENCIALYCIVFAARTEP